jgi:tRNA(Arg) A34 adenosine deaminase TadA
MCTGAIDRTGLGRVVFAHSNEQLGALKPGGGFPRVPQDGPALFDEARVPVDGSYE